MSLARKLDDAGFLVLAEVEPPKGTDVSDFVSVAVRVKDRLDAVVVPEMNNAVMKMSSLGGCILLQQKGVETVMQVACRDRNRLALQADLLAAWALGVGNLMIVSGQDPREGDQRAAKPVYDLTQEELLETVRNFGSGRDLAGVDLAGGTAFTVGTTLDPDKAARELELFRNRVDQGSRFFVTPPLFDPEGIRSLAAKLGPDRSRLIITVLILKSLGMARYINLHLKNVSVPEEYLERFKTTKDRGREGVDLAVETVRAVREAGFGGVMISPLGWEDRLPQILDRVG